MIGQSKKWSWFKRQRYVLFAVAFIVVVFGIAFKTSPKATPIEETGNTWSTAPSAATVPAPAAPQTLLDISGTGSRQTDTFITTGRWHVTYTFDCTDYGMRGNFQFDVKNTDGSSNYDIGANDLAQTGGTTDYYYDSGEHYLTVNSECAWHIVVGG